MYNRYPNPMLDSRYRRRDGRNSQGMDGMDGMDGRRGRRRDRGRMPQMRQPSSYGMPRSRDYRSDYDRRNDYNGHDYGPYQYDDLYYGYYGTTPFNMVKSRGEYDYADGNDYGDYGSGYTPDYGPEPNMMYNGDHAGSKGGIGMGGNELNKEELHMWAEKLKHSIDEKERESLTKEKILKKAEELAIPVDKIGKEELYTAVLLMYAIHGKTIGNANMDMFIKLAKDFLCNPVDAAQYSEKLASYFDYIAN